MILVHDNTTIKWEDGGNRYCLHVIQDDQPDDPRQECQDSVSMMACWHRRYNLGDDIGNLLPYEFWQDLVRKNVPEEEVNEAAAAGGLSSVAVKKNEENPDLYDVHLEDGTDYEGLRKESLVYYILEDLPISDCQKLLKPYAEWTPLWLLDHSGLSISCGSRNSFADPWDSGQLGYMVVLKDKIAAELRLGPDSGDEWRQRASDLMKDDVEVYNQYLHGDTFFFRVYEFTDDDDWDEIDGCGGYYGDDLMRNGMLESVGYHFQEAIERGAYEIGEAERHVVVFYTF